MNPPFTWREVLQRFRAHRRLAVVAGLVFAVSTFLAGIGLLGIRASARWTGIFAQDVHVIVYLAEEMDPGRTRDLADLLARLPFIERVRTVSPTDARAHLAATAGRLGVSGFEAMDASIYPHSLEVSFLPSANLAVQVADLAKRLRPVPGILFVDDMTEGMGQLSGWMRLGRRAGVTVLIAVGVLTLVFPLLMLRWLRRAQAARSAVLHQLGATPFAVRFPPAVVFATAIAAGGSLALLALAFFAEPSLRRVEMGLGLSLPPMPAFPVSQALTALAVLSMAGLFAGYLVSTSRNDHA